MEALPPNPESTYLNSWAICWPRRRDFVPAIAFIIFCIWRNWFRSWFTSWGRVPLPLHMRRFLLHPNEAGVLALFRGHGEDDGFGLVELVVVQVSGSDAVFELANAGDHVEDLAQAAHLT